MASGYEGAKWRPSGITLSVRVVYFLSSSWDLLMSSFPNCENYIASKFLKLGKN